MKWQHDGKRLSTKSMQLSVLSFLRPFWTYCRQTATKIVFYKRWHTKSSQFHNLKIMPVSAPKGTAPSHLNVCWPVALTSHVVKSWFRISLQFAYQPNLTVDDAELTPRSECPARTKLSYSPTVHSPSSDCCYWGRHCNRWLSSPLSYVDG